MSCKGRSQRIMGGPAGLLLALGLLLASGVLDTELGARKEPFGIRCTPARGGCVRCLCHAEIFPGCSRAALAQMQPNAASEANPLGVVSSSVYLARPSPRGRLLLALAIFLVQALPSPYRRPLIDAPGKTPENPEQPKVMHAGTGLHGRRAGATRGSRRGGAAVASHRHRRPGVDGPGAAPPRVPDVVCARAWVNTCSG